MNTGRQIGSALMTGSVFVQAMLLAIAGGVFGDPGRANLVVLILLCTFLLSVAIVGAALFASSSSIRSNPDGE
jgi:hypothetical protein